MTRQERIVYQSQAALLPDAEVIGSAIDDIVETAARNNQRDNLTGALVFSDGIFMQVLEGDEAAVRETFERISRDNRHCDVAVLFEDAARDRHYPDWSMGFQSLDGSEWLEFPSADGRPKDLRAVAVDMGRAKDLLMMLRQCGLDPAKDIATPVS